MSFRVTAHLEGVSVGRCEGNVVFLLVIISGVKWMFV